MGEVILDVFFGGEIRTPGRFAAGAICECAERPLARRIVFRPHQRRATSRTTDVDRRIRSDTTVVTRVLHELPTTALTLDLDNRHTLRRLRDRDDLRVLLHK